MKSTTTFLAKASMMLLAVLFSLTGAWAQKTLPYEYGFENNDLAAEGWTMENCKSSTGIYSSLKRTGDYAFCFSFNANPPQYLISPEFEGTSAMDVSFWYRPGSSNNPETFQVGYSTTTNATDAFTWEAEVTATDKDNWHQYETSFPAGTKFVAIRLNSYDKLYLYLDDLSFTAPSGVVRPETLEVSGITSSEAVLTWTGGTGTYNVEYKKAAETDWTTAITNTTAKTFTLTGLESFTSYQARVQSVSGSNVSGWKTVDFSTAIGFPYIEDFATGLPTTWTRYTGLLENIMNNTANLAPATSGWFVSTSNGVLDDNKACANIYGTSCQKWLVTPAIPVAANAQLAFDVAYTAYSGSAVAPAQTGVDDKFVVLISTDNMATWTILRQWDNAGSTFVLNDLTPAGEYVSFALDAYAGQNVNVAFYIESTVVNADNNLHIDNVAFQEKTTCEKPTGLTVSYTGGTEATVSWVSEESNFDIDVNGTVTENVSNPYTLTGLSYETTYKIKVRAKNSKGVSDWTKPITFTTPIACPAPTDPVCTAVTATTATLDWTENGTATQWELCLNDDEENLIKVSSKPYTLTSLNEEQEYTFKVRACNSNTEKSQWSANGAFQPTSKWVIGSGTATNAYLPTHTIYKYSLSQQIYTAAELGAAAYIHSIDFYSIAYERTRKLDIYMVSTDKASFDSKTDWIPVTASDLVFSGDVTFAEKAWTTIELDTPFNYDGTHNVAIVVDDNTNGEDWSPNFRVFEATAQALRVYNDAINYDPLDPPTEAGSPYVLNVKNQIRLVKGEALSAQKPTGLMVSYTDGTEATVSWESEEPSFDIDVNGTVTENVSNPYTLTGLSYATTYNIKVRAKNSSGVSGWTMPVTFTTVVACPAPTNPVCTAATATTATLDWTENGKATKWEICLNGDEENLIKVSSKPYTLTSLNEDQEYTFKVRACNSDTEKSEWSANTTFVPSDKRVIGSGTATNASLPSHTYYKYALTQQIYTTAELGAAAYIYSIDFYSTATERTRKLDIYMVSTDKASFNNNTDWIAVTAGDLVFSGDVTFAENAWTTIDLDTPFIYDGTQNVAIVVDDNTNSDISGSGFRVFNATAQALSIHNDATNYDPFDPPTEGGNLAILNVKNQIRLVKGEAPSVLRPTGLKVSYTGGLEATVSWESEEPFFDIDVNGTVTEDVANPTTLTGLSYATTYNIKVRAKNSNGVSGWTSPVTFTTDLSDDMCQIKLELTDSYGDGWSGNAIKIVDVATGTVIGTYTNQDLDGGSSGVEVNTLYATVPNDRDIEFQFVKGNYANECSWAVYDVNDELIFEGTFVGQKNDDISSGTLYTWHVDCTVSPYKRPSDLAALEIGSRKATLSWTENGTATAWVIELTDNNAEATTYVNASENPFTVTGLNPETEYFVRVRPAGENEKWSSGISFTTLVAFPAPTELAADNVTDTSAEISWTGNEDASRYNLRYRVTPSGVTDFEDSSMGEWTTIDADGDGYDWVLGSEVGGIYLKEGSSLAGTGNGSSQDFVTSGSYSNPAGTALTPDNWLVSPLVTLGGSISFFAGGQDEAWAAEHFGVAVSTTSNTDPAAFTMLEEWTMNADGTGSKSSRRKDQGVWGLFTVDLSAYAGKTGYVAIRHFNCTDQFLLNIDDISIEQPGEEPWTVVNNAESPYTIEGLAFETKYQVQVQAVYADGESVWTGTSFVTLEECPAPVNLSVKPGSRTAELSWKERSTATEWEICLDGDEGNLIPADSNPFMLTGLTPNTEYTVKVRAINGEKKSHWTASVNFYTDIKFPEPTELAAENVTSKSAVITWTSDASATGTELEYAAFNPTDLEWKQYDDDTFKGGIGGSYGRRTWGVMYPAITGNAVTKVSIYESSLFNTEDITIYIAEGGDDEPDTYLYEETITPEAADAFHEITLGTPVELTPGQNLWVILEESGNYPMVGCAAYSEPNNTWVCFGDTWDHITNYNNLKYGWMIRAEVSNIDFESVSWSPNIEATSPYKLEGLTPETLYSVAMRSVYGTEGKSGWAFTSFVTAEGLPVPTNIAADLAADGATLTWEGTGDSYNVQYRTADESRKFFEDYFEAGLDQWTLITEGEGEGWIIDTSSGTHGATSYSWKDDVAYNVNNWLITPQIEFGGILHFNVTVHPDYPDSYEVLLSTTGNGTTDFTTVLQPMAKGKTGNVNIDLSDYDGQKGYIAIHHVDKDSYLLFIDNFYVYDAVPAGEWQTMAVTEPTATISGLVNNRLYEYQVQSVKDGSTSEWSDAGEFVLLTLDSNTDNTKLIKKYENKLAHVTLTNRTLYKDDGWNTLTLPFDLTPEQLAASPLADADFRTFNGVTVEGTKATLSFTEKGELDSSGLQAGKPYIIQWASDNNIENPEFANVILKREPKPLAYTIGSVYVVFWGVYAPLTIVGENKSILFLGADDKLFWPTAGASIPAHSAYFDIWGDITELGIKEFNVPTPDCISLTPTLSEGEGEWYDLGGRKLAGKPSMRGIYVNGGRKISIK